MIQLSDVRYALRLWRRHPTLVAVAGLSLGLGVGATTTMYSVVNRVAHYELGFDDVDRLAIVVEHRPRARHPRAAAELRDRRRRCSSTDSRSRPSASFRAGGTPVTLSGTDETRRVSSRCRSTSNGLAITGVPPLLGRTYRPEDFDDRHQAEGGALDRRQLRHVAAAPRRRADVIGTSIHVDGEPRTVIGVMPRGFELVPWEDDIAFWAANDLRIPQARWMIAVGRLKPGVSLAAAQAEAAAISRQRAGGAGRKAGNGGGAGSSRCRRRSSAARATGSPSCWARSASCSSSPAPTSPTCCWRRARHGRRSWPCARPPGASRAPADAAAPHRERALVARRVRLRPAARVLGHAAVRASSCRPGSRSCCVTSASTRACSASRSPSPSPPAWSSACCRRCARRAST